MEHYANAQLPGGDYGTASYKRRNPTSGQTGRAYKCEIDKRKYTTQSTQKGQQISFAEVRIAAQGRWEGIHRAHSIHLATTTHQKHTPCPGCGGRDRFRLDKSYPDTGRWICGGGGDLQQGDGFSLLGHVHGWTPQEQLRAVAGYLGLLPDMDAADRAKLHAKAQEQAEAMRNDARLKDEQARRDSNVLDAPTPWRMR